MTEYDIQCPTGEETIDDFELFEAVWYFEGSCTPETTYLARIVGVRDDHIIIFKYINGLWRRVETLPNRLSHRDRSFSTELFLERQISISIDGLKFDLPNEWYNSFSRAGDR